MMNPWVLGKIELNRYGINWCCLYEDAEAISARTQIFFNTSGNKEK